MAEQKGVMQKRELTWLKQQTQNYTCEKRLARKKLVVGTKTWEDGGMDECCRCLIGQKRSYLTGDPVVKLQAFCSDKDKSELKNVPGLLIWDTSICCWGREMGVRVWGENSNTDWPLAANVTYNPFHYLKYFSSWQEKNIIMCNIWRTKLYFLVHIGVFLLY